MALADAYTSNMAGTTAKLGGIKVTVRGQELSSKTFSELRRELKAIYEEATR